MIKEIYVPDSKAGKTFPFILHLEDAHAQPDAQKNSRALLQYLKEQYGLHTLFLEGGFDTLDSSLLGFFVDQKSNERLMEKLEKTGFVGGAEQFLVQEKGKVQAYGVEDVDLYRQNLEAFRGIYGAKTETDTFLKHIRQDIVDRSAIVFHKELKDFFESQLLHDETEGGFLSRFALLKTYADRVLRLNLEDAREQYDWPQLVRFCKLQELERSLKEKPADPKERTKLIQWLNEKGLKEWEASFEAPSETKESRLVFEKFYAQAGPQGFRFENYPLLSREIASAILREEIQATDLFLELERLHKNILEKLTRTEDERTLIRRYQDYRFLKSLFSLRLSREEFESLKVRVKDLRSFLSGLTPKKSSADPAKIESFLKEALSFYEIAQKREEAMLRNLLAAMGQAKQENAILITGGFHSEGLSELFKTHGISYVRVAPRISRVQSESDYLKLMTLGAYAPESRSYLRSPTLTMRLGVLRSELGAPLADYILKGLNRSLQDVISVSGKPFNNELMRSHLRPEVLDAQSLIQNADALVFRPEARDPKNEPIARARPKRSDGTESRWDIFDRFVLKLDRLTFEQIQAADQISALSKKREALSGMGIPEAEEVEGKYLVSALQKALENKKPAVPVRRKTVWPALLEPISPSGRYLLAYKDKNPYDGWVVKIPVNWTMLDLGVLQGAAIAKKRLGNGLGATLMTIDGRHDGNDFMFYDVKGEPVISSAVVIQEKIIPFVQYLKQIARRNSNEANIQKAISYVEKYRQLVIAMYKQGAVDTDHDNIVGNYGIRPVDDSVTIFDIGDVSEDPRDAREFVKGIEGFNGQMAEAFQEIDGTFLDPRISDYFQTHAFKREDFFKEGKDLFGSEYSPDHSHMVFPYSEQDVRKMFLEGRLQGFYSRIRPESRSRRAELLAGENARQLTFQDILKPKPQETVPVPAPKEAQELFESPEQMEMELFRKDPAVRQGVQQLGIDVTEKENRLTIVFPAPQKMKNPEMEFRAYQVMLAAHATTRDSLVILPTALGKTNVAILALHHLLQEQKENRNFKIVMTAPTNVLVHQHFKTLIRFFPDTAIVEINSGLPSEEREKLWKQGKIILTTNELIAKSQEYFDGVTHWRVPVEEADYLIVDEAHLARGDHAMVTTVEQFRSRDHLKPSFLGLTATPDIPQEIHSWLLRLGLKQQDALAASWEDDWVKPYIWERHVVRHDVVFDAKTRLTHLLLQASKPIPQIHELILEASEENSKEAWKRAYQQIKQIEHEHPHLSWIKAVFLIMLETYWQESSENMNQADTYLFELMSWLDTYRPVNDEDKKLYEGLTELLAQTVIERVRIVFQKWRQEGLDRLSKFLEKQHQKQIFTEEEAPYQGPTALRTIPRQLPEPVRREYERLRQKGNYEETHEFLYDYIYEYYFLWIIQYFQTLLEQYGPIALAKGIADLLSKESDKQSWNHLALPSLQKARIIRYAGWLDHHRIQHPKLNKLLSLLEEGEPIQDYKAIIFVENVSVAQSLKGSIEAKFGAGSAGLLIGKSIRQGMTKSIQMNRKTQTQAVENFKNGKFKYLVATQVGELGLDIPNVDKVIFYEPTSDHRRQIQRMGRTGRHKAGEVDILVTKGTLEEAKYWTAQHRAARVQKWIRDQQEIHSYRNPPSLRPESKDHSQHRVMTMYDVIRYTMDFSKTAEMLQKIMNASMAGMIDKGDLIWRQTLPAVERYLDAYKRRGYVPDSYKVLSLLVKAIIAFEILTGKRTAGVPQVKRTPPKQVAHAHPNGKDRKYRFWSDAELTQKIKTVISILENGDLSAKIRDPKLSLPQFDAPQISRLQELASAESFAYREKTDLEDIFTRFDRRFDYVQKRALRPESRMVHIPEWRLFMGQRSEAFNRKVLELFQHMANYEPLLGKHGLHVMAFSLLTAHQMNMNLYGPFASTLAAGALLHDLGKIKVPRWILRSPKTPLPFLEDMIMKNHPIHGVKIMEDLYGFKIVRKIVRYHHEWFNGQGYPEGLVGVAIPLGARIVSVADAYDTMVSERDYKDPAADQEAIAELKRKARIQFDPRIVKAFVQSHTRGLMSFAAEIAETYSDQIRPESRGKFVATLSIDSGNEKFKAGKITMTLFNAEIRNVPLEDTRKMYHSGKDAVILGLFFTNVENEIIRNEGMQAWEEKVIHVPGAMAYVRCYIRGKQLVIGEIQSEGYGYLKSNEKLRRRYQDWQKIMRLAVEVYARNFPDIEEIIYPTAESLSEKWPARAFPGVFNRLEHLVITPFFVKSLRMFQKILTDVMRPFVRSLFRWMGESESAQRMKKRIFIEAINRDLIQIIYEKDLQKFGYTVQDLVQGIPWEGHLTLKRAWVKKLQPVKEDLVISGFGERLNIEAEISIRPESQRNLFPGRAFSMEDLLHAKKVETPYGLIPFFVSQRHDEILEWIKSLQRQGLITQEVTLINFDTHPDTTSEVFEELNEGSWVRWMRMEKIFLGRAVWVKNRASYNPTLRGTTSEELEAGYGDQKINIFDSLQDIQRNLSGPAVITLDLDFIAPKGEEIISMKTLEQRVEAFMSAIFSSGIRPIAFHISLSPKYLSHLNPLFFKQMEEVLPEMIMDWLRKKNAASLRERPESREIQETIEGDLVSRVILDAELLGKISPEDQANLRAILASGDNEEVIQKTGAYPWGMAEPKRTLILPLRKSFKYQGQVWKALVIKGILVPSLGEIQILDQKSAGQPEITLNMKEGLPYWEDIAPMPKGTMKTAIAEREYRNHQAALQHKERVKLPLGYGEILNKTFRYQDAAKGSQEEKVGYFISLIPQERPLRIADLFERMITLIAAHRKEAMTEANQSSLNRLERFYTQRVGQYVRLVRRLNQWAKHGNPNYGNVGFYSGEFFIEDLEGLKPLAVYPAQGDKLGYLLRDLRSILLSMKDLLGDSMGHVMSHPDEDGRLELISAHQFFIQTRSAIWQAFLEGYFEKTYRDPKFKDFFDVIKEPSRGIYHLDRYTETILNSPQKVPLDRLDHPLMEVLVAEFNKEVLTSERPEARILGDLERWSHQRSKELVSKTSETAQRDISGFVKNHIQHFRNNFLAELVRHDPVFYDRDLRKAVLWTDWVGVPGNALETWDGEEVRGTWVEGVSWDPLLATDAFMRIFTLQASHSFLKDLLGHAARFQLKEDQLLAQILTDIRYIELLAIIYILKKVKNLHTKLMPLNILTASSQAEKASETISKILSTATKLEEIRLPLPIDSRKEPFWSLWGKRLGVIKPQPHQQDFSDMDYRYWRNRTIAVHEDLLQEVLAEGADARMKRRALITQLVEKTVGFYLAEASPDRNEIEALVSEIEKNIEDNVFFNYAPGPGKRPESKEKPLKGVRLEEPNLSSKEFEDHFQLIFSHDFLQEHWETVRKMQEDIHLDIRSYSRADISPEKIGQELVASFDNVALVTEQRLQTVPELKEAPRSKDKYVTFAVHVGQDVIEALMAARYDPKGKVYNHYTIQESFDILEMDQTLIYGSFDGAKPRERKGAISFLFLGKQFPIETATTLASLLIAGGVPAAKKVKVMHGSHTLTSIKTLSDMANYSEQQDLPFKEGPLGAERRPEAKENPEIAALLKAVDYKTVIARLIQWETEHDQERLDAAIDTIISLSVDARRVPCCVNHLHLNTILEAIRLHPPLRKTVAEHVAVFLKTPDLGEMFKSVVAELVQKAMALDMTVENKETISFSARLAELVSQTDLIAGLKDWFMIWKEYRAHDYFWHETLEGKDVVLSAEKRIILKAYATNWYFLFEDSRPVGFVFAMASRSDRKAYFFIHIFDQNDTHRGFGHAVVKWLADQVSSPSEEASVGEFFPATSNTAAFMAKCQKDGIFSRLEVLSTRASNAQIITESASPWELFMSLGSMPVQSNKMESVFIRGIVPPQGLPLSSEKIRPESRAVAKLIFGENIDLWLEKNRTTEWDRASREAAAEARAQMLLDPSSTELLRKKTIEPYELLRLMVEKNVQPGTTSLHLFLRDLRKRLPSEVAAKIPLVYLSVSDYVGLISTLKSEPIQEFLHSQAFWEMPSSSRLMALVRQMKASGYIAQSKNLTAIYSALPERLAPKLHRRQVSVVDLPIAVFEQIEAILQDPRATKLIRDSLPKVPFKEDRLAVFYEYIRMLGLPLDTEDLGQLYAALPDHFPGTDLEKRSLMRYVNLTYPAYKQLREALANSQVQEYLNSKTFFDISKNLRMKHLVQKIRDLQLPLESQDLAGLYTGLPSQLSSFVYRSDIAKPRTALRPESRSNVQISELGITSDMPGWYFLMAFGVDPVKAQIEPLDEVWGRVKLAQHEILGLKGASLKAAVFESLQHITGETGSLQDVDQAYLLTKENKPVAIVWPIHENENQRLLIYSLDHPGQSALYGDASEIFINEELGSFNPFFEKWLGGRYGIVPSRVRNVLRSETGSFWAKYAVRRMKSGIAFPTVYLPGEPSTAETIGYLRQMIKSGKIDLGQKTVADIGSGSGVVSAALFELGARQVHAADISLLKLMNTQAQIALDEKIAERINSLGLHLKEYPEADFYIFNSPTFNLETAQTDTARKAAETSNLDLSAKELEGILEGSAARAKPEAQFLLRIFFHFSLEQELKTLIERSGWEIHSEEKIELRPISYDNEGNPTFHPLRQSVFLLQIRSKIRPESKSRPSSEISFTEEERQVAHLAFDIFRSAQVAAFSKAAFKDFMMPFMPGVYLPGIESSKDYLSLLTDQGKVTAAPEKISLMFKALPKGNEPWFLMLTDLMARNTKIRVQWIVPEASRAEFSVLRDRTVKEVSRERKEKEISAGVNLELKTREEDVVSFIGRDQERALVYDMRERGEEALRGIGNALQVRKHPGCTLLVYDNAPIDQKVYALLAAIDLLTERKEDRFPKEIQTALGLLRFTENLRIAAEAKHSLEQAA